MAKSSPKKQNCTTRSSPVKVKPTVSQREKPPHIPSRCNKCEGRPLRSQCCHTKAGENYLREQQVLSSLHAGPSSSQVITRLPSPPSPAVTPHPLPISPTRSIQPPGNVLLTPNDIPDDVIDPLLRTPSRFEPVNNFVASADAGGQHEPSPDVASSNPFLSSPVGTTAGALTPSTSTTQSSQRGAKARRATVKDPYHGFVDGAYRGTEPFQICRSHAVTPPFTGPNSTTKASAAFLEMMKSLIQRCEDLSNMTSCWLFIGAQHPNASGDTLHYASPRLTRDVPELIETLATDFCSAIGYAKDLRRFDLADAHKKLELARRQNEDLEAQMEAIASEKLCHEEELRHYKEKFGILPLDSA